MSPRRSLIASLIAAALLLSASPALAMTPKAVTPGWSPLTPPSDLALYEASYPFVLYSIACGDMSATGWSADFADDTAFATILVTTAPVARACMDAPESVVVRQGSRSFEARPWNADPAVGLGLVAVVPDSSAIDWDFVPTPRVGQWVGIDARTATGEPLPMLQRRIVSVGEDTFTLDAPVGQEYVGAPVADNLARALGTITTAGVEVTGMPPVCATLFVCTDPTRVWWDITSPSAPSDVRVVGGKGKVTATWKAAASDGGDEVAYRYRIDQGSWTNTEKFRVAVKARKGTKVTVSVQSVNEAGPGPIVTVSAKAK